MKLSTRDASTYLAKPDPDRTGLLIYGGDAMRVALSRQQVIKALIGAFFVRVSLRCPLANTRKSGCPARRDNFLRLP